MVMGTVQIDGVLRPLLQVEQRAVTRALGVRRRRLGRLRRRLFVFSSVVFGALWGLTMVASRAPVIVITVVWLVIGALLTLWSYFSARRELTKDVNRFEQALRRNEAREVRVQSTEMVEFEEEEDEGTCYAFQLDGGKILFISGQDYYSSAMFPNTDFSLVDVYDENGACIGELIHKRGQKLEPRRTVPARLKSGLSIPGHLEIIEGKLSELEGSLISNSAIRSLERMEHV